MLPTHLPPASNLQTIIYVFDGVDTVLVAGRQGDIEIDYPCTLVGVSLFADQPGSLVLDIWKDVLANGAPTVADSITAAAKPTLTAEEYSNDETLTDWNKAFAVGDRFRLNIDSCTSIIRATVKFKVRRNG